MRISYNLLSHLSQKWYMKKTLILLMSLFVLSCVTHKNIKQYNFADNTIMYFLPASTWLGDNLKANIDFNFKNNIETETICNISIIRKGKLPSGISSILFNADSVTYSLNNIKLLSVDSRSGMVRITSVLHHDDFLEVMKSHTIFLEIIIDGEKYKCIPQKDFLLLQEEFQNNYFEIANILNP